jgi:hypothetical protein
MPDFSIQHSLLISDVRTGYRNWSLFHPDLHYQHRPVRLHHNLVRQVVQQKPLPASCLVRADYQQIVIPFSRFVEDFFHDWPVPDARPYNGLQRRQDRHIPFA